MTQQTNIPKDWQKVALDELFEIKSGTTPSTQIKEYWNNGSINWFTPADLGKQQEDQIYIDESIRKVSEQALKKTNLNKLPVDAILISTRAPVGHIAILKEGGTFNQGCRGLIPKDKNLINTLFYAYYFDTKKYELQNKAGQSTFKELSKDLLGSFEIIFINKKTQDRIANILSTVDSAITQTNNAIEKTERIKRGMMDKLLTKGIGHKQFKKTELGEIPEDWDVVNLASVALVKGRIGWQGLTVKEYLQEGDYILITGTDFYNGKINWKSCCFVDKNRFMQDEYIQVKSKDILITKDGTIGKVAFVDNLPKPATLNSGIFVIRLQEHKISPEFVFIMMNSKFFDNFMQLLKSGSTIPHLYQRDFVNFKFPFPQSRGEQGQIIKILSTIDSKLNQLKQRKVKYEKIKKGLMDDLLSGKKRVKVN